MTEKQLADLMADIIYQHPGGKAQAHACAEAIVRRLKAMAVLKGVRES